MYALKSKKYFEFCCIAETKREFEKKIEKAFWDWKGLLMKGNEKILEDYLSQYDKVIVTVVPYK